jgi:hypothetical protein
MTFHKWFILFQFTYDHGFLKVHHCTNLAPVPAILMYKQAGLVFNYNFWAENSNSPNPQKPHPPGKICWHQAFD